MRRVSCASPLLGVPGLSRWGRCGFRARNRRNRVEGRTRLALGGMATVAASVAVVCAVAMTTTVALADSAGSPAGARSVIVPASATTPVAASATPSPTPAPQVPAGRGRNRSRRLSPKTSRRRSPLRRRPAEQQSTAAEDEIVAEVEKSGLVGRGVCLGAEARLVVRTHRGVDRPPRVQDRRQAAPRHRLGSAELERLRRGRPHRSPSSRRRGYTVRTRPLWFDVRIEERAIAGPPRLTRLPWPATPKPGLSPAPGVPPTPGASSWAGRPRRAHSQR